MQICEEPSESSYTYDEFEVLLKADIHRYNYGQIQTVLYHDVDDSRNASEYTYIVADGNSVITTPISGDSGNIFILIGTDVVDLPFINERQMEAFVYR